MKSTLLYKKSFPVTRYSVSVPDDVDLGAIQGSGVTRIEQFQFRSIDDTYDEMSLGWELPFGAGAVSARFIILSMRLDERKISSAVLKRLCEKEEARIKAERQILKLSRGQRLEIKESIRLALIKKAYPVTSSFDMVWDMDTQEVWLMSCSDRVKVLFEDLFKETFEGFGLEEVVHYTQALGIIGADHLSKITPLIPDKGMVLLDAIAEKKFLGSEFLLWLWYKIDTTAIGFEAFALVPSIRLEDSTGTQLVITKGDGDFLEGKKAVLLGKSPALLGIMEESEGFEIVFDGKDLTLKSMVLPLLESEANAEDSNSDVGLALARIDAIGQGINLFKTLYKTYLEQRSDPDAWTEVLAEIDMWLFSENDK